MSVQTMEQVSPFVFTLPLLTRNRTRRKRVAAMLLSKRHLFCYSDS